VFYLVLSLIKTEQGETAIAKVTSYHSNMVKTLTDWMKDRDIIKDDLRNLKKYLTNRCKEVHCPEA